MTYDNILLETYVENIQELEFERASLTIIPATTMKLRKSSLPAKDLPAHVTVATHTARINFFCHLGGIIPPGANPVIFVRRYDYNHVYPFCQCT